MLSTVISIVIVILGVLGLVSLPITQYPDIAPPTIEVSTTYTGANAQTVLNSVIAPLEEQINGVENMDYMSSTATNTGAAEIEITFKQGTDPDMAAVNVQNRVAKAQGLLPSEVTQVGVITQKRQSSMLVLFSIVVALACVTTAVALVSSAASYFSKLSGGRLRYTWLVVAICLFSAVFSCIGLDQIVSIASPVLSIVYPPTLVLIFLSFFDRHIRSDWVFRMAALGALLTSLLTTAADFGASLPFLARLPLAEFGFGWVLPAAVCGFIGALIERKEV